MSYNLIAEGDLDLFELGSAAAELAPLELFPIDREALGIAIPSSRAGAAAATALRALVERLWSQDAAVFDLYSGEPIATPAALAEVLQRIGG
jgi:hypothetical protein